MPIPCDTELIHQLILKWYATRKWAVKMLSEAFGLSEISEICRHRDASLDGPWQFKVHGSGVDVRQPHNKGGIDFEFHDHGPDTCRLRIFLVKQYNAGNLQKRHWRGLLQDNARFLQACEDFASIRSHTYKQHTERIQQIIPNQHDKFPCPCCGYWTLDELGHHEICDVCFWQDDPIQFDDIDYEVGANIESLRQARSVFRKDEAQAKLDPYCRLPRQSEKPPYCWYTFMGNHPSSGLEEP